MGLSKGYIQVYTGDGKGKTTAALGLAMRALGHNLTVRVIQFMKGNIEYGELEMSRRLSPQFQLVQMGRETFVDKKNPAPKDIAMAEKALELASKYIEEGDCDLLILDEINVACDFRLIDLNDVLSLMDKKPDKMELIMTGRYAAREILDKADLVTEMKDIKHYFTKGIDARVGVER